MVDEVRGPDSEREVTHMNGHAGWNFTHGLTQQGPGLRGCFQCELWDVFNRAVLLGMDTGCECSAVQCSALQLVAI